MKKSHCSFVNCFPFPPLHSLFFILFFLLVGSPILFLTGCGHKTERLYPYGWTRTDPAFDSLTLRLERACLDMEPDSVVVPMIEQMGKLAKGDVAFPEKMARYHYWNARYKLRHSTVEDAMEEFHVSLALTDSARHPYDVARIRWNMELDEPEGAEGYFEALKKLQLFKEFNDLPMQAAYNMTLGGIMSEVEDPASALRYLNSADSLLVLLDFQRQAAGNMLNRAKALQKAGKKKEGIALLKNSLNDSAFYKDPIAVNIAQWNLYLETDSLPLLQAAYEGLANDYNEESYRPVYGAFLIKEYAKRGMVDSVAALMPGIVADSAMVLPNNNYVRDYYFGLAEGERALGNYKAATDYYSKASKAIYAMLDEGAPDEVVIIEQRRLIDETLHKMEMKRKDTTLWLLVALIIVTLGAGTVIILYRRRISKHREQQLKASLAEEQSRRKVLALEIAMEENRRLGENIRETVGSLEKEGRVDPSVQGALEATLKSHDISRAVQDGFVSTFGDVNPAFLEALDKKYPNLSKTERRLAVYISLGLDNKHISRLTGVRPESVKQARWRLRNKLALPEGVSLEEEIRGLMGKL